MKDLKKYLPFALRAIIAFLFLLSAVAKLYPSPYFAISTFEVKQLYSLGFSETLAPYFSRILIGIEFALGFLILQNHFLKKLIIPATILLLAVFTTHLFYVTYLTGGNSGNCGCFGSLLPMTPIEAIVKNIVAMCLLVVLFKILPRENNEKHNFWVLTTLTFGSVLFLFMLSPIKGSTSNYTVSSIEESIIDSVSTIPETPISDKNSKENISEPLKTTSTQDTKTVEKVVPTVKSGYTKYFSKIDSGKQILCFFVPGCDHCRATAKELTEMKKQIPNFPPISVLFMDEEANLIPDFFQFAGTQYPYKIIDVIGFWKVLGTNKDVPGVKLLENGKEIKYYFGTKEDKFNAEEFRNLLK